MDRSDKNLPSLSVIIPFKDAEATLGKLAAALLPQAPPRAGVELIAVDDGSRDEGAAVLSQAGFHVITNPKSAGPAAARNDGAVAATGEILLFLDADVIPGPNLVEHVRRRFGEDPDLAALSGVYHIDPANEGFFPACKALRCHDWFRGRERFGSLETACAAVRREIFLAAGGFDERFAGADVEDYELGYRLGGAQGIELDHAMHVKHHFPGFWKNLENFARRTYKWAGLSRPMPFDTVATTPREAGAALCTWGALAFLLVTLGTGKEIFGYVTFAFAGLQLYLRRRFFLLCQREKGPRFTLASVLVTMAADLVVVPAAFLGTLGRLLRSRGRARA